MMQEIRFHGRGGQGTVVASIILAKAFFSAGYHVQSFPVFGVERRGAPVEAYLRLDTQKIRIRCNVYTPDHVVVQDVRLLETVPVKSGLKAGGWILINAADQPKNLSDFAGFRLAWVDATGIAIQNRLGTHTQPMINTAIIGAFARVMEKPPLQMISDSIREDIRTKPEQNIQACRDAFESTTIFGLVQ
jgi:pyruvate ferredoxin oxidoreductase gamma subunit/2-oxoisovalerate ferredoxin oxidoreductase gamma subunit